MNLGTTKLLGATIFAAVVFGQGCVPMMVPLWYDGVGRMAGADNKTPSAQSAENCKSWECWDGYKCGQCEAGGENTTK
jgi:hypothetical protein